MKGFTLTELTVAAVIVGIITGAVISFSLFQSRSFNVGTTHTIVHELARLSMDRMVKDIESASSVYASATLLGTPYTTGGTTLIVSIPSIDGGGLIIDGANDFIAYVLQGTTLTRVEDANSLSIRTDDGPTIISKDIKALSFTYIPDISTTKTVGVSLTSLKETGGKSIEKRLKTLVLLRNRPR